MKTKITTLIKKHGWNILFFAALAVLIFNADAKAFVLRQLFTIGLFKANLPQKATTQPATAAAPNLSFVNLNGETINTNSLKGKVVFINFWAAWCPPCKAEMPSINALYNQLKNDDNYVFLMVDVDHKLPASEQYMKKKAFELPVYAPAGTIAPELFNGVLPTTLVLDANGAVAMKHEGIANYNTEQFLLQLQQLAGK